MSAPLGATAPSLCDIAPTVLAHLGAAAPNMEGRSLLAAAKEAAEGEARKWTSPLEKTYTEEEEALLEARMRSLGYYE